MKFKKLFLRRIKSRAFAEACKTRPGLSEQEFEDALDRAYAAGALSDDKILMKAAQEDPQAFGVREGGGLLDVIKRIIDWLSDPTNQGKILNIVKFIMSILVMFGI